MRYCLRLAFDGTNYSGWQIQRNAHSVQQEIEMALEVLLGEKLELIGCGRTDTGVHATDFYAHFDFEKTLKSHFLFKMNKVLPTDIVVKQLYKADGDFHARFSAVEREYCYLITRRKNPFLMEKAWYRYGEMELSAMNEAAALLLGEHDFKAFSKGRTQVNHYRCDVRKAIWTKTEDEVLQFTIAADRFLRNMVRAIVGTLIEVGTGKKTKEDFKAIIESRMRSNAGTSVPGYGLYLQRVKYPEALLTLIQDI